MTTPMISRPTDPSAKPASQAADILPDPPITRPPLPPAGLAARQKAPAGSLRWRMAGASARGAAHIHNDLVNQDAIALREPQPGQAAPLLLAVSDGHGSKKYIRSDVGSHLAVKSALSVLQEFYDGRRQETNISAIKREAEERLPALLERTWKEEVSRHLETNPFLEEEYKTLNANGFPDCREELEQNPYTAFGATLLAVLVAPQYVLYVQLGDGDILAVDAGGGASRPLPPLDELVGEETYSLCQQNARRYFQIRVVPVEDRFPVMILASTDGLSKSYSHDEGFLKTGFDLLTMVREEGIRSVGERLEALLDEISRAGSGDDITLGIIKRAETGESDTTNERLLALEKHVGTVDREMQAVAQDKQEAAQELKTMSSLLETRSDAAGSQLKAMQQEVDAQRQRQRATARRLNITALGLLASSGIAAAALGLDITQMRHAHSPAVPAGQFAAAPFRHAPAALPRVLIKMDAPPSAENAPHTKSQPNAAFAEPKTNAAPPYSGRKAKKAKDAPTESEAGEEQND